MHANIVFGNKECGCNLSNVSLYNDEFLGLDLDITNSVAPNYIPTTDLVRGLDVTFGNNYVEINKYQ